MKLTSIAIGAAALVLSACGGGGDSAPVSGGQGPQTSTVSGVAAAGAAMQGATVTLTDAAGKSVNCPADATTGAFQCDVTGLTAPFVLAATGNVADSQATLISLSASGGTQTINITPLSNAIAATLVSGNPTQLLTDTGLLQSKVTASAVSAMVKAYSDALADLLAATGNTGVDLISGPLTAGAPGLDRLLDQIKVNVLPTGGVQIASVAGTSSDTPTTLQLAPGVAPSASNKASLPSVATINGQPVSSLPSASDLATLQAAFNQCFSGSTGATRTGGTVPACGNIFVDDVAAGSLSTSIPPNNTKYLSNGVTKDQEFFGPAPSGGTPGIFADDAMNGAVFSLPEVINVIAPDKLWIKLSWTRTDAIRDGTQAIVQLALQPAARTSSDTGWRFVGNQRPVLTKITGNAQKWDWLNPAKPFTGTNAFISSLNLQVGATDSSNGMAVDFAIVKGPGLNNGLFLQRSAGVCNTLNIRAQLTPTQTPAQAAAMLPESTCRNNYKLAGVAQDPLAQSAFFWPINRAYANPPLTTSEFLAITPFSAYTIDIYEGGNTTTPAHNYTVHLRTPPPAPDTLRQYAWQKVGQETQDRLTPTAGAAFTGGPTFPVNWTGASGVPFVKRSNVQIRSTIGTAAQAFVNGSARAKPVAPGTVMSLDVPGDQNTSFPAVAGAAGGTDVSLASLAWSDAFDLLFSATAEYDH